VAEQPTALAKLGMGGLITVLFLPQAAILVLVGIAASWWLAGVLAVAYLAFLAAGYLIARSPQGFFGRLLRVADAEPGDYSQYTPRNLFLKPLISGLPAAIALIVVAFLTVDESMEVTVAVSIPCPIVGFAVGELLWSWMEKRRRRDEAVVEDQGIP
jgi:hypothetical protein